MTKSPVKYFVVDAFTDKAFKGNPAAVCLLEDVRDEEWLQAVVRELNMSTTCFLTQISNSESQSATPRFEIRWFTPVAEVKLCGHATLAASHVVFTYGLVKSEEIEYSSMSGVLTAKKILEPRPMSAIIDCKNGNVNGHDQEGYFIELDFPVVPIAEFDSADISQISKSLNGASIIEVQKTTTAEDLFVVLPSGEAVAGVEPDFDEVKRCSGRGIIITGPAPPKSGFDLYSRFFCPKFGVNEDPVCGSAHCTIAPYWSKKLGKFDFVAYQASPRGGVINLHFDEKNQRVLLRGKAIVVIEGSILVLLPSGKAAAEVEPQIDDIKKSPGRGIIITGPAQPESGFDFVSRFFCPKLGINEDPVTGSAHCVLAPYWSKKLGKCDFVAYQASPRSGVIDLHLDAKNQRVLLRGKAVVVTEGSILV